MDSQTEGLRQMVEERDLGIASPCPNWHLSIVLGTGHSGGTLWFEHQWLREVSLADCLGTT